jgi:hypothetical protein
MMRLLACFLPSFVLLVACGDGPAEAQGPARYDADSVERLMVGTIEPAADLIWDSVSTTVSSAGVEERYPRNDREWAAVRRSAETLTEAGALLTEGTRSRDGGEWARRARELITAAEATVKAADARSPDAILETGEQIYSACIGCHQRYPGRMAQ